MVTGKARKGNRFLNGVATFLIKLILGLVSYISVCQLVRKHLVKSGPMLFKADKNSRKEVTPLSPGLTVLDKIKMSLLFHLCHCYFHA